MWWRLAARTAVLWLGKRRVWLVCLSLAPLALACRGGRRNEIHAPLRIHLFQKIIYFTGGAVLNTLCMLHLLSENPASFYRFCCLLASFIFQAILCQRRVMFVISRESDLHLLLNYDLPWCVSHGSYVYIPSDKLCFVWDSYTDTLLSNLGFHLPTDMPTKCRMPTAVIPGERAKRSAATEEITATSWNRLTKMTCTNRTILPLWMVLSDVLSGPLLCRPACVTRRLAVTAGLTDAGRSSMPRWRNKALFQQTTYSCGIWRSIRGIGLARSQSLGWAEWVLMK